MDASGSTAVGLSIGALARSVGVPVETLRTWESRYGYPLAERLPSGHRRFPLDAVERLRLVARLLERGHKPSSVVPAGLDELRSLIRLGPAEGAPDRAQVASAAPGEFDAWFGALDQLDAMGLEALLHEGWNARGALPFLDGFLSAFLVEIGERWRQGRVDVAGEHVASAVIAQFLSRQWRSMSDVSRGPLALCATLSGEHHVLGLHMAAVALASSGWRVRFLGADTPVGAIVAAASALSPAAVAVSVSAAADAGAVHDDLAHLRDQLPEGTTLWVGGGAPMEGVGNARWPGSLTELATEARARR